MVVKRNYYVFVSGLVYYILIMFYLGKLIVDEYFELNWLLLYVGIILYDLGKVIEFFGFMLIEYMFVGNLIGYLVLIDEEIIKVCFVLKISEVDEDVFVLCYMVLVYYGLLEYGLFVCLRIMEVEILY